jgi:UDP-N-acetylmuramate--alanine ligase
MPGVTSEMILNKMTNADKRILEKAALVDWVKDHKPELLITAGAGDIDTLVQPIKNILENKSADKQK